MKIVRSDGSLAGGMQWSAHLRRAHTARHWTHFVIVTALVTLVSGCASFGRTQPTRTPFPTFTPTPVNAAAAPDAPSGEGVVNGAEQAAATNTPTLTPVPPTATATPAPTATPTDVPTATNTPTPTPQPTATMTPTATPVPVYTFELEAAEKHPTESLAPNVVRVFLWVYEPGGLGLPGYSLRVTHNGAELPVDQTSLGGLPSLTRERPSPYARFTNMNAIFVEAQAGTWVVQLVDETGTPAGPPAEFNLSSDEVTRELYVRYRRE